MQFATQAPQQQSMPAQVGNLLLMPLPCSCMKPAHLSRRAVQGSQYPPAQQAYPGGNYYTPAQQAHPQGNQGYPTIQN